MCVLCKRFFLFNFTHFLKNDNCIQVATKIILIIHFDNKHKFNGYFLFSVFFSPYYYFFTCLMVSYYYDIVYNVYVFFPSFFIINNLIMFTMRNNWILI